MAGDEDYDGFDPENLRKSLNNHAGWNDDQIWQAHIELCEEKISPASFIFSPIESSVSEGWIEKYKKNINILELRNA